MPERLLKAVAVTPGKAVALLPGLREALRGSGPALLPHPEGSPPPASLGAGEPLQVTDGDDDPHDPTTAIVVTSGSTGAPKGAVLPASALQASASATHERLGGPGWWLLALPADHIAGLQVLIRSLVAGTEPVELPAGGFEAGAFVTAATELTRRAGGGRRYTSLVPTQLVRLLDAGGAALAALAGFDAVLVGGAHLSDTLRHQAGDAGVNLVGSYGMTETCGGCVYDRVPLAGVQLAVHEGRISLGGPTIARGYRGGAAPGPGTGFHTDEHGVRWFTSNDAGRLDDASGSPRLTLFGRLDGAITTGGLTLAPAPIEAALLQLSGVLDVVVVGVPDAQWGERVVAALVLQPGSAQPTLPEVRRHVAALVSAESAPRQLLLVDALPLLGSGKPDRQAVADLAR